MKRCMTFMRICDGLIYRWRILSLFVAGFVSGRLSKDGSGSGDNTDETDEGGKCGTRRQDEGTSTVTR
jgi:hypothetical protein